MLHRRRVITSYSIHYTKLYELETSLHATTGPALDRPKDLVGILTQLGEGDLLFIDEIHRVSYNFV